MTVKFFILLVISFFGCCLGDCGLESCNDLKTVKECKNVQKCISEVWLKQTPTGQRDDVCDICLKMVKEARDQLMSNETRSDIKAVLEGSCALLRIKPVVVECKKLADEFVPELVAMLSSQMDPEVVCSVAKLCNNQLYSNKQKASKECSDCLNFAYAAEDLIENIPGDEFKSEMVQMCRSMGSYSDACYYYTPLFSDFYYNQTRYALKKQPCEVTDVCPKGNSFPRPPRMVSWKEAKNKMCSLCPDVMINLKSRVLLIESLADFKLQVFKTCRALALFKNSCARILDGYYPKLYKYMTEKFEPVEFCKEKFVFCTRREDDVFAWPLLPVSGVSDTQPNFEDFLAQSGVLDIVVAGEVPDEPEPRITLSVGDPIDHKGPLLGLKKEDGTCKTCVQLFNFITNFIQRNPDYIKEVLKIVCQEMSNRTCCLNFVEYSYQEIKTIILKNYNAENICPELVPGCKADSKVFRDSEPSREGACSFCLKGFHSLNEGLKGNELLPEIEKALIPMCLPAPEESRAICESFVKTLTSIVAKASETDICSHLRVCGPEPEWPVHAVQIFKEKPSCKVCLLVVQTLYDQVQDKSNEAEIRKILEGLCSDLPQKIQGPCNVIVITYTDEIVQMITNNLKPEEVCNKLHFCRKTVTTPSTTEAATRPQETELKGWGKIPCNFCLTAIRMLMDQLQSNKTEEAIRQAIDGLCNYMPEETRDTCRNLIDQYTEDIIDMIIADFNASEICMYLKICGPQPTTLASVPNFGVTTNEIRDRYNPVETCDMCKFMAAKGNDDNAAEELLALLVDICIKDPGHRYEDCKILLTEKVLPYGKIALADFDDVCGEFKICPLERKAPEMELLEKMHHAVQECAMCETLAQIIAGHKIMLEDGYDFSEHAPLICSSVPRNKKSQCESMLISYGPSIVNLLNNGTRTEDVCYRVVLCDEGQQAKLRMPVSAVEPSGLNECMQGPKFWCKNVKNAKKCGTLPHCQITVWKDGKAPEPTL